MASGPAVLPVGHLRMQDLALAMMLVLAAVVSGCTVGAAPSTVVSLARLVGDEQAYLNQTVQVLATVRVFGESDPSARHYVIEDVGQHRVALLPADMAARFVGQRVRVVGRFEFDDAFGRLIRIESIEPVDSTASP